MQPETLSIDPVHTSDDRDELRHLDYLSARMRALLDRGAITTESFEAIGADCRERREAIDRNGRYQALIGRSRALAKGRPGDALDWTERARELDPDRLEAWSLSVDLLWAMERDEEAVARCAEAADRFPQLRHEHELLVSHQAERAEARRHRAEKIARERDLADRLAEARRAMDDRRYAEAAELAAEVLAATPNRLDALQMAAYALQQLGRLDEAIVHYRALVWLQRSNPVWSEWVRNLEIRRRLGKMVGETEEPESDGKATAAVVLDAPPPRWSWSSFAAEFFEEHWQKLILCLAVLLIVVSSTVGAYLLLGDLLWRPAGKCAVALVWTVLFAALGVGLIRWGAERTGQMMLVATLIVVPIHFMLAGEFRLVTEPTPVGLAVAAVDGLALIAMVRVVSGMLAPAGPSRFVSVALLLLSVGSVLTSRGSPVGWGWQFAAFQAPAVVFLGSVWGLGRRRWGETDEDQRRFALLVLGLLGFAFLATTIRTGAYALRIEPELYSVPVMLGAMATVTASRRLAPFESDARKLAGIRYAGYVLSALAFAMAMAAPPTTSAILSGNTVATGLLGFVLYAASLRRDRHPAFLYLAIAALVAARVGAQYFLADRVRLVIEAVRVLLGYPDHLPLAYFAALGLAFNPAMAALSAWFRRGWNDDRLARHCHYIGFPVAVVACLWSVQEPEAAVIVLSGYALLFGLAIWLYAAPVLGSATILAICGACYFGSTLVPGVTVADRAVLAIVLAWLFLGVGRALRRLGSATDYQVPWIHASRVLVPIGFLVATGSIAAWGANSAGAATAFLLGGVLATIGVIERPRVLPAGLVLLCFVELTICGLAMLAGGRPLSRGAYGLLLVGDGLVLLAIAELLERISVLRHTIVESGRGTELPPSTDLGLADVRPPGPVFDRLPLSIRFAAVYFSTLPDGADHSGTLRVFLPVLSLFVLGLTQVADYITFSSLGSAWVPGVVWLLGAPALLGISRRTRDIPLVYLGIGQFVAGGLALSYWAFPFDRAGVAAGSMAVTSAALALLLWTMGVVARRRGLSDFYVGPCLNASLGLTFLVLALALGSRMMARDAYRFDVLALALNAGVTLFLSNTLRRAGLTYAAIVHIVVATYIVLFSVGNNDPRMAYVLGLAAVVEAIVFWGIGFACERVAAGRWRPYALPVYHATVAMTLLGILLSDRSSAVLAMAAAALLLNIKSLPRVEWLYGAVACLAAACYFRWLSSMTPTGLLASTMAWAFGLWMAGVLAQRYRAILCEGLGLRPLAYKFPLFHSSISAASIALALRAWTDPAWTSYPWLPLSLSVLAFLLPRAYPRREWIHLALLFVVWGTVSLVFSFLTSMAAVAMTGMILALVLLLLEQAVRSHEPAIRERLGVVDVGYVGVVRWWSAALFSLTSALSIAMVFLGMAAAFGMGPRPDGSSTSAEWWPGLIALAVAAFYLVDCFADPEVWGVVAPEAILPILHGVLVLGLWWLGTPGSVLGRWLPAGADYFSIITAIAAISAIHLGRRFADPVTWHELGWVGDVRSEAARRALALQACGLALLAIAFTGGTASLTTVSTMVLGALAMALAGFMGGWPMAAGLACLAWAGAWSTLGLLLARDLGFPPGDQQGTWTACGALISAFTIWQWAGLLRGGGRASKETITGDTPSDLPRFAAIAESVASGVGILASVLVFLSGRSSGISADWVSFGGVGVLLAAAGLHFLLAARWRSEWPVYLAQMMMVGAYLEFRLAFPTSNAADAAVFTMLAYLDLGIADALDRIDRHGRYTRPTRYTSLVLPMLPLLMLPETTRAGDLSLFYLAAAATFYATACGRMRWKGLGYASAVFANAALWVTWSRMGWQFADSPQFFLVPVGLSAILFAEVNHDLGRAMVNLIRTIGLIVIYASMALPIWQSASFGAWVTLLLASLLGVFLGIGLRLQTFLWLGLATFVLDLVYQMGRVSVDHAMARWFIMFALGLSLFLFVALNEKKRILGQMRDYYALVRTWE